MQWAAKAMQYALYWLLLLQPVLGLLHSSAHGGPVKVFFLFRLPPLIERDHDLAEKIRAIHAIVANLLLLLIIIHALAALFHHFIRRDETLTRMLPGAARHKKSASHDCAKCETQRDENANCPRFSASGASPAALLKFQSET
jgi:cytochrome b561